MDVRLQMLLRTYNADPTLENAEMFIHALQRGLPPLTPLEEPLSLPQLRSRSSTEEPITVNEVVEVNWADIFADDDTASYGDFLDMLSDKVTHEGGLQELDWEIVDVGPYNQLFIRVTGYIECDCPGCDVCGSHCLPDCTSGEGEECTADI